MIVDKLRHSKLRHDKLRAAKLREGAPRQAGGAAVTPLFSLPLNSSGLSNLTQSLTINGSTVAPSFLYQGADGGASSLVATVGDDLPIASSGLTPSQKGTPFLDEDDKSLVWNRNLGVLKYYEAAASTTGDITTEDFVVEAVFWGSSETHDFTPKLAGGVGWYLSNGNGTLTLNVLNGAATQAIVGAKTNGAFVHCMFFVDRDGSGVCYTNGVAGTAVNVSALAALSLSSAAKLQVGQTTATTGRYALAHYAMWKQSGWLDTHLQEAVAAERFNKITGIWPSIATGTATPTYIRATAAHVEKYAAGVRSLHRVGLDWPRVCSRADPTNSKLIKGYLAERAATNLILQSEDMSTTWAKTNAGDTINANAATAPDGQATMDAIVADATDTEHGWTQAVTLTATKHTLSCHAAPGNRDWIYLSDDTVANAWCYFNVATGAVGTSGAAATGYISSDPYEGDSYRCELVFTGTAAPHTLRVEAALADSDNTFSGDGATDSVYVWGIQCEAASRASSYIQTTTAQATRNADSLTYDMSDGNGTTGTTGSVFSEMLSTVNPDDYSYIYELYASATNTLQHRVRNLTDGPSYTFARDTTGVLVNSTSATVIGDDEAHSLLDTWDAAFRSYVDSATVDTQQNPLARSIPALNGGLAVGMTDTGASQLGGIVSNLRIYDQVVDYDDVPSLLEAI